MTLFSYFRFFFIIYLPFILFQTLSLVYLFGFKGSTEYFLFTYHYQLIFLVVISIFSLIISNFYMKTVEIHINVIKERSRNRYSCFFRIKVDDLVNLNSLSAFYSLLPFSISFNLLESIMYVSIIGNNPQKMIEKKNDMFRYLSMAFRDVKLLRDTDLKKFIRKRSILEDKKKSHHIVQNLLFKNKDDLVNFLDLIKNQDKSNILNVDIITTFDKDNKKNNSHLKNEFGYFRGFEIKIISINRIDDISSKIGFIKIKKPKNSFDNLSFITSNNATNLTLSDGLKQISLIIRFLNNDFNKNNREEIDKSIVKNPNYAKLPTTKEEYNNENNQSLKSKQEEVKSEIHLESKNKIENKKINEFKPETKINPSKESSIIKVDSVIPVIDKFQLENKENNLLDYLSNQKEMKIPRIDNNEYKDNKQLIPCKSDKKPIKVEKMSKKENIVNNKSLTKVNSDFCSKYNYNSFDNAIQQLNGIKNTNEKRNIQNNDLNKKIQYDLNKTILSSKPILNNFCKKLCPLHRDSNGKDFNFELCNKLLLRSFRIYKDKNTLEALKQTKIYSLEIFIDHIYSLFENYIEKLESSICFLVFLFSINKEIFFGEEEINIIVSILKKVNKPSLLSKITNEDQKLSHSEKIKIINS